jgi:lysophospholipase L1-like esterase
MAVRLEATRVPGLVVLPPIAPRFENAQPHIRLYRAGLVQVAAEFDLPTVSVDERFTAEAEPLFFEDLFHLNARGHAIVAEEIRDAVVEQEWLSAATLP